MMTQVECRIWTVSASIQGAAECLRELDARMMVVNHDKLFVTGLILLSQADRVLQWAAQPPQQGTIVQFIF
jgi:hypothetical protein